MSQNLQSPTTGPFGIDTDINLQVLARAVRKHWIIAVAVTAIGVIGALLYTSRQDKVYQAEASVQFDPRAVTPLGGDGAETGLDSYWSNQEYFATQHQIITSRRIALATVKKLGLDKDAAFVQMLPAGQAPKGPGIKPEAAAEILRRRLEVEPVEQSRLAKVKYRDGDSARAQRVLNTLLETYVEENLDSSLESMNNRADWLDTQLARLKTDLESQEMSLHDFKKNKNLLSVSYDDQSNMLRAEIQQLNGVLTSVKARKETVAARLEVIKAINLDDPAQIPAGELLSSASLSVLRGQYITSLTERQRVLALGKGEMHPDVRAISADLESTKQAIIEEISNIKAGVQADLDAVNRELQGLAGLYQTAAKSALELNLNELMFSRLKRSKDNTEKLFSLVMERSTESGMAKVMPFNNVRVVDQALAPKVPVAPNPSQILAMGVFAGLIFGLIGATSRELLDRTIKSSEDGEQVMGLPFLGALPDVADPKARASTYYGGRRARERSEMPPERLVQQDTRSGVAEAARSIRTNLMFMSPDQPFKTILVTSAGPAEGKTTVAACLAIAMAQAGQKICLIDCDLRRPRLHSLFHKENTGGLTSALLDPSAVDKMMLDTDVENLALLNAGLMPPNPAELLQSESLSQVLQHLQNRFDRIVIDSPPVGLVTDGVILSTRVDATVIIVRAMKTRKDMARRAVRAVRDVGGNSVGFVVNAMGDGGKYGYTQYYYANAPEQALSA